MSNNELPNAVPNVKSNPIVAAFLSLIFFGGGGQIYLGQVKKGILLIAITIFLLPIVPILGALDAYILAKKLKKGETINEWTIFSWEDLKEHRVGLGYLFIGFFGWFIFSFIINVFVILNLFDNPYKSEITVIIVMLAFQLFGYGLAYLAIRKNKRSIGIGIITASIPYFVGFIIRSGCAPAGFPFPISLFSFC